MPRQLLHSRGGGSRGSIPSRPAELWIARPLKRTSKQTTPHPKLAGIEECGVKLQHVAILQLSISGLCVAKCRPPRPPSPRPQGCQNSVASSCGDLSGCPTPSIRIQPSSCKRLSSRRKTFPLFVTINDDSTPVGETSGPHRW